MLLGFSDLVDTVETGCHARHQLLKIRLVGIYFLLGLFLAGCVSYKLLYGLMGDYIADEINSYFRPSETDKYYIRIKSNQFAQWHSQYMLPRYSTSLLSLANKVEGGAPARDLADIVSKDISNKLAMLVEGAVPFVADIIFRLNKPTKIDKFQKRMVENDQKHRQKVLTQKERLEVKKKKRLKKNLRRFMGPLNDRQKYFVNQYVNEFSKTNKRWLYTRELRQRSLFEFLAKQPNKTDISSYISRLALRGHEVVDPDYELISRLRWKLFHELLHGVFDAMDYVQRERLTKNLREYAGLIKDL